MGKTVPRCRVPRAALGTPFSTRNAQRGTRNAQRGFTLVEVLVAAAVLAIGISAGVRTLGALTRSSVAAEERATAVRLAGERLALLEADAQVAAAETNGSFESEPRFQWEQDVVAAAEVGLLEATVTVLWHDGLAERRYSVSTYLLDPAQQPATDAETVDG